MANHPDDPHTHTPEGPEDAPRGAMRDASWSERKELLREGVDEGEGTPLVASREELPRGAIFTTDERREPRPHFAVAVGMLAVIVLVTWLSLAMVWLMAGTDVATDLVPGFWFWMPVVVVAATAIGFFAAVRRWPEGEETWVGRRVLAGVVWGLLATAGGLFLIGLVGQAVRALG